ncbi:small ribosomal subunit protein eS31 domain containing protein [Babesia gibsoni]|uniref:Small ribosomal subunit protein eS31 domain containing protein n=1 Tax=Babesia gibsoni TaxID=33632 RepID=A0AAD8PGY4_BABGI|nr:small ribosomal subunit protein eS31 domain containing protein [Babesia gibsoni]
MEAGQIFVSLFNGNTAVFNSYDATTIADLKSRLAEAYNLEGCTQSLWAGLTEAEDATLIAELLDEELTVNLVQHIDVCGGRKKRKKKQYTTPKKIKHKHKKVKLSVLKFYKVDGDKVVKLLKECPASTCGKGVFMASHHNRSYCGRCGLTYMLNAAE